MRTDHAAIRNVSAMKGRSVANASMGGAMYTAALDRRSRYSHCSPLATETVIRGVLWLRSDRTQSLHSQIWSATAVACVVVQKRS
jgi:hypothetical protein